MNEHFSFWRWMFYASLTVLMIWVILKSAGIINTPLWLEYGVPITSLTIAVLSLFHELMKDINSIKIDVVLLKNQFINLNANVEYLDKDIDVMKKDMTLIKNKLQIV